MLATRGRDELGVLMHARRRRMPHVAVVLGLLHSVRIGRDHTSLQNAYRIFYNQAVGAFWLAIWLGQLHNRAVRVETVTW